MPLPIILDCDPGHDDAVAMMLAAGSDAIDLRAITTVAGNCPLDLATINARRVAALWRAATSRSPPAPPGPASANWSPPPTSTARPASTATTSPRRRRSTSATRSR